MAETSTARTSPHWTRNLIVIVIFTVVSAVGGLIKIPSPVGSIALDSAAGFFCAAFFNPIVGGLVGAMGHLASAATAGFPLQLLHIIVAIEMFIWCYLFGAIINHYQKMWALVLASVLAIVLNGVIGPYMLVLIPRIGLPSSMVNTLIPFLLFAASINIILAAVAYKVLATLDIGDL